MNVLSFIASIVLAITFLQGLYILSRDFRSESNRLFFFICLCFAIWLFGCAFGYSAHTRDNAFFWLKVASPGFISLHAFVLHFTLRYTKTVKSGLIYAIYIPSLYFLYVSISDNLVFSDIFRYGQYWVMVPDYEAPSFYLLMVNYTSYYMISLLLLYKKFKNTESLRVRNKSLIIFAAIIITVASYNIEPFIAPIFFDYHTYGQAPLYSIVWISLIWYAMKKYRFLGVYEQFLPMDALDSLSEMVIITDCRRKIFKVNHVLKERLNLNSADISLKEIFVENELIERLLVCVESQPLSDVSLNLRVTRGDTLHVTADITSFKDRFGDNVGFIITLREMHDVCCLINRNGISERENQIIQLILSGNSNKKISETLEISLRTVETHITHIYDKLGVTKRSELINYCTSIIRIPASPLPDSFE